MEKSTKLGHRKGSGIGGNPAGEWVGGWWGGLQKNLHSTWGLFVGDG